MDSNMRDQSVSDLRYTITWRNPYKPRPAGLPKILCSSPFEEELTLPWIIASNWGLSAWAIGIYFEHPKPKRRMDEEKRAAMRRKNSRSGLIILPGSPRLMKLNSTREWMNSLA